MLKITRPNKISMSFGQPEATAVADALELLFDGYVITKVSQVNNSAAIILEFEKNEAKDLG